MNYNVRCVSEVKASDTQAGYGIAKGQHFLTSNSQHLLRTNLIPLK